MWWTNKTKNRRFHREDTLDVKVETKKAASARWRTIITAFFAAVATLAIGLLVWFNGQQAYERLVLENQALAIRRIEIHTDGVLEPEQLRQWAGVKEGDNLLALDLDQIKRYLELVPLLKEVSVERVLPDTLKLSVTERVPVARAHVLAPRLEEPGYELSVYLLDAEGYVMLPVTNKLDQPSHPLESLAIISGLSNSDMRPGRAIDSPPVMAALKLIEIFGRSPMAGQVDLDRIDVSKSEVLLVMTSQGNDVTLGLKNLESQLQRWRLIQDHGQKTGRLMAAADLSITNNMPVVWQDTNQTAPVRGLEIKKPLPKKKHV